MLNVAQKMNNLGFLISLNAVPNAADAVANDVQYYLKCCVNAQRSVANDSICCLQTLRLVRDALFHSKGDNFTDMNQVNITIY